MRAPSHPIARARERYGVDLFTRDLKAIAELIQQNHGKFEAQQPDGSTTWRLTYRDVPMRLVIDKTFYHVITFLPLHPKPQPRRRVRIWKNGVAKWVDVDGGDVRG